MLRSVQAGRPGAPAPPRGVTASLSAAIRTQTTAILAHGPWVNESQLPRTYIPGLNSRPWHALEGDGGYPHLQPVVDLLEGAASALSVEYADLKAQGLLHVETECINDDAAHPGAWQTYSINAAWVDRNETTDCSFDTPVACALLKAIRDATAHFTSPFHVLRMGYSALAPGAHLQPHCGMTNGQLKFHVGIVVPMVGKGKDRQPCAGNREVRLSHIAAAYAVLFASRPFRNACRKRDTLVAQTQGPFL